MAFFTPAMIMALTAAGTGVGGLALNASRSGAQPQQQSALAGDALRNATANQQNQALVQALINQRSVAGTTDSSGSTTRYDPATNQWISTLGKLPQAAQTAADQAGISRNTTDLRQAQFANAQSAQRAALAGAGADAARRNFESFRPMGQDELVGLLQQQATNASNATFRPLVADTLRTFARTGTAAGPVLGQIGKDSAANLRDSLIDAQIKGMTGVDQINASKRGDLASAATTSASLATPQFGYSGINPSTYSQTMSQLLAGRAQNSAIAPAYGASAANSAAKETNDAYGVAAKAVPDPNFGTQQGINGLQQLGSLTGKGGAINDLVSAISKYNSPSSTSYTLPGDAGSVKAMNEMFGYPTNAG